MVEDSKFKSVKLKKITIERIMKSKEEHLDHHPEMKNIKLSLDYCINFLCKYYEEN